MVVHSRFIEDAWYTVESIRKDLVSKLEARTPLTQEDLDSYNRALATLKTQQVLWSDYDGLLDERHDQPYADRL